MTQLHDLTALEQAAAVRRGELTSAQLVEHYLGRIAALDPDLGAFVTVTADSARAQASSLVAGGEATGSLFGVPTAIKDLTMTAGVRTTFGSAAFADFVPPVDADVVGLLRAAGMISLGKTSTSEFGLSLYVETELGPPARNPWSPAHIAGGSSGGAAAAVAAGLLPIAHGNDAGGSVRIPSAICGLVGYKPSRGLISNGPLGFGTFGLATHGCIARTVADAAALLDAMAGPVPGEPYPLPPRPGTGFLAAVQRVDGDRRLRIGRFLTPFLTEAPVHPACAAAVDTAAAVLGELGHEVVDVDLPRPPGLTGWFETLWWSLAVSLVVPPGTDDRLLAVTRLLRERGRTVTAAELVDALTQLQAVVRQAAAQMAGLDLLLCPTLAQPQAPVGWFTGDGPSEDFTRQERFSPYCAWFNVSGAPAASLPVGRTDDGLPVGVQLGGVALTTSYSVDELVLGTAAAVERAIPWSDRHPDLWHAPSAG